jgi:hypothetical protein
MILSTFQALAVALLAVIPGAAYVFTLESRLGSFKSSLADRSTRLLAASAVFIALFSAPLYVLYRHYITSHLLQSGHASALAIELIALGYLAIPFCCALVVALGVRRRWPLFNVLWSESSEPRAWDYAWNSRSAIIRLRLKSGTWLGGNFIGSEWPSPSSYASGYPEEGDLYFAEQVAVDATDGSFIAEAGDEPVIIKRGLLIRWADIEYVEFIDY